MGNAIGSERISRTVGYKIETEDFSEVTPNLPQSVAIFGEANTANQADLDLTPKLITSAQQAGQLYGYGSPIYLAMRILRPVFGGGIGGIPTRVYPQAQAVGATSKKLSITPTGTATAGGVHTVKIAGRGVVDGVSYDIQIVEGDENADINSKIVDAVNAILGAPVTASLSGYDSILESKWKGLTANDLNVDVDTNGKDLGITYTIDNDVQSATGTPSVSAALAAIGDVWETVVLNTYGTVSSVVNALEAFNGIPDPENPTGRFIATVGKPFVAVTGSIADDDTTFTDSKKDQCTIALAPAPLSKGLPFEAAANMVLLYARKAQHTPELDVAGSKYTDMPTPTDIGSMATYDNRDLFVKKGSSTVSLSSGKYLVQDFVTTWHPVGETPAQFAYVRTLYCIDMNVKFTYQIKEETYVVDHVIANDDDILEVDKFVKPKTWKGVIAKMSEELVSRGLIVDAQFMQDNTSVSISTTNPSRFNTRFKYKRSSVALLSDTVAVAGFNFGS